MQHSNVSGVSEYMQTSRCVYMTMTDYFLDSYINKKTNNHPKQ